MKVNESISRDILRLLIWFPFRWLTSVIPLNRAFYLFKSMGDMHFYLSKGKKKNISETLKRLLGVDNNTAMHIVKKNFENHYTDRLHIFLYPRLTDRERIEEYVYFENLKVLDAELKKGKGVLLVQPHFGPVQITLLALAIYGYKPIQIGYPSDQGLSRIGKSVAYKYRIKYEGMLPSPILPADGYLGKGYRHLIKGGVVLTTGDGAGGGIFLGEHKRFNFLGTERMFPLGPAAWAIKTKSAFIPTFIIPEIYNRFRIVFERPIEGIYNDIEKDETHITEQFISITEEYIKKYPYCWHFWDEI